MLETLLSPLHAALGTGVEPKDLGFGQMVLRGVIVFVAALVMVRMGNKRFFAENTAFDVILGITLASVLARSINGSAPLFASIGTGFVLVGLHRLLAFIAYHSHWFGSLIKGHADIVVEGGRPVTRNLRKNHLSERDLLEELRLQAQVTDLDAVETAHMERNGRISVIRREPK